MRHHLSASRRAAAIVLAFLILSSLGPSPIAARAAARYSLSLSASGGAIAAEPAAGPYDAGTTVWLTPVAAPGNLFIGWTIDGRESGWAGRLGVTMDRDHTVGARFAPRPGFADLPDGPAAEAVAQLAARGIARGYGDGQFGPQDRVTRAQMAAFICRTLGWDGEEHGTPFPDRGPIDDALWRNVGTLAARGIARGYDDGTYDPTGTVIRAQVISLITRSYVATGTWQPQQGDPAPTSVAAGHRADLATFIHYAGAPPTYSGGDWPTWNTPADRQWVAQTLWQALNSVGGAAQASPPAAPPPSATPAPTASPTPAPSTAPLPTPAPTASPTPAPSTAPPPTPTPAPSTAPPPPPTPTPSPLPSASPVPPRGTGGFVGRSGTQFTLDGQPFRFVGFNLFDAAATARYRCAWWGAYSDAELDRTFAAMQAQAGASVVRFWAFQPYTASGTDWSGIDRVIAAARKYDLKLIPVLENGPSHCTNYGGAKWERDDRFYGNAYRRDFTYGYPLSLPDYIDRIVGRYRDEPTIMAWMIMNEADTGDVAGLYTFAATLSAQIKAIDPNHLVTLGTQSNGVSGSSGADFIRLYGLPTLDFAEGHDYAFWGDDNAPLPGSPDGVRLPSPNSPACLTTAYIPDNARIGCALAQATQLLDKPFLMGEAGVRGGRDAAARARRAALLGAKIDAFFANGGAGYLVWQWNRILDTEEYDIVEGTNDPLLPIMRRHAAAFAAQGQVMSSSPSSGGLVGQAPPAVLAEPPRTARLSRRAVRE